MIVYLTCTSSNLSHPNFCVGLCVVVVDQLPTLKRIGVRSFPATVISHIQHSVSNLSTKGPGTLSVSSAPSPAAASSSTTSSPSSSSTTTSCSSLSSCFNLKPSRTNGGVEEEEENHLHHPSACCNHTLVVFSSGSSGPPKPILLDKESVLRQLQSSLTRPPPGDPPIAPIITITDARNSLFALAGRSTLYLCQQERWIEDLKDSNATHLTCTPRTLSLIPPHYLPASCVEITVGGAHTPSNLRRQFERPGRRITEIYGTSECGSIAVDGRVIPSVRFRLENVDSAGVGELVILQGGKKEIRTGDLVQQLEERRIQVVGRSLASFKISDGTFFHPEPLERLLELKLSHGVHAIFIYSGFNSVVFCKNGYNVQSIHEELMKKDMQCIAPPLRLIEGDFSTVPTTSTGKYHRQGVYDMYKHLFKQLPPPPSSSLLPNYMKIQSARAGSVATGDEREKIVLMANRAETDPILDFLQNETGITNVEHAVDLLLNSLSLAALCQSIYRQFEIPLTPTHLQRNISLRELAHLLRRALTEGAHILQMYRPLDVNFELEELKRMEREVDEQKRSQPVSPSMKQSSLEPLVVLLTGGNGFLGSHVLKELATMSPGRIKKVICLVRRGTTKKMQNSSSTVPYSCLQPEDNKNFIDGARGYVHEVDSSNEKKWQEDPRKVEVDCLEGDIGERQMGLSEMEWEELVRHPLHGIIHCAAAVNALHSYDRLRASNVVSVIEVLRLSRLTNAVVVHVSSAAVFNAYSCPKGGFPDDFELSANPKISHLSGYAQSKWMAERLLKATTELAYRIGT